MALLHKAISLIRRCELSQRRSEASIAHLQAKIDEIDNDIAALDRQDALLRKMMMQQQQPCLTNRAGLLMVQQRNAVRRQKLQMIGLQRVEMREQHSKLKKEQEEARRMRLFWQRKAEKFQRCVRSERQQMRLSQVLREETEIQEKYSWRK
ncbi:hypothetical protein [Glaciimonas sp. PCH181]|uniref:hypothetical protein n=1 Tax=Glaciimonas sp. PCH181 TaxID=2133943 RepID=UPI001374D216|nr:hypothetical protein [Glaciimonas sp. PCH181]